MCSLTVHWLPAVQSSLAHAAPVVTPLPALVVAIPLLGAALLSGARRWLRRTVSDALGIVTAALTFALSSDLLLHVLHGPIVYWFGGWAPRQTTVLGISFVAEPIGTVLAVTAALLTTLALLFSWRFVDAGERHMQPLMLIFLAAMTGFTLTGDLFNLFVWFELMSTAAFALCGLKTAEPAPLQGALNFAITNTVAAFMVLTGLAMLYAVTGALNMAQVALALGQRHDPLVLFAFALMTCGFLVKAAAVPFHFWLPDAHAVAPTPVCVLFSGLMVELGVYAVMRLSTTVFAGPLSSRSVAAAHLLLSFGVLTALFGAVMCYAEHHLKRLLAFSTVSHTGLMLTAFALVDMSGVSQGTGPAHTTSTVAIGAVVVYILAHAMVKSSLFFSSGGVLLRLRAIGERDLFGRGRCAPGLAVLWFLGGAGLAAAPPFATLLGEAAGARAASLSGTHGIAFVFVIAGALTGGAVFRVGMHTFFGWGSQPITDRAAEVGELPETPDTDSRLRWYHVAPPTLCLLLAVSMTFSAGIWLPRLEAAAADFTSLPQYLRWVYELQLTMPELHGLAQHPVIAAAGETNLIPKPDLHAALLHGSLATFLALMLALSSVFRERLPRTLRAGARLEGERRLRTLQSGHPGDYILYLTFGVAVFGWAAMLLLR